MDDKKEYAFSLFSSKVMLDNINHIKGIIQRIRQKEGGIGSDADEMALYRMMQDVDLLVDIVDGLKASYDELKGQFDTLMTATTNYRNQQEGMKAVYEKMLGERNELIQNLRAQLAPEIPEPDPED